MAETTEPTGAETLLAKVNQLLERVKAPASEGDGDPATGKPIPYERFFAVNQRAKAAEEALTAMRGEVESLGTAHEASLTTLREETATNVGALQARHAEDLTFARHGFDDGDIGSIRTQWKAQPEEGRAESAGEYWEATVAAAKAHHDNPDKNEAPGIHRTLTPLLPTFEGAGGGGNEQRQGGNSAPPRGGRRQADPGIPQRGSGRAAVLESIRKSRGES